VEYVLDKVSRKVYVYEELLQTFLETLASTYSAVVNTMGSQSWQNIW